MKNEDIITPITILIVGALLFLYIRKRNSISQINNGNVPGAITNNYINDPVLAAYQPGLGLRASPSINIDIGNQGLNYLSNKYIPMFGFVGMAQGETFH